MWDGSHPLLLTNCRPHRPKTGSHQYPFHIFGFHREPQVLTKYPTRRGHLRSLCEFWEYWPWRFVPKVWPLALGTANIGQFGIYFQSWWYDRIRDLKDRFYRDRRLRIAIAQRILVLGILVTILLKFGNRAWLGFSFWWKNGKGQIWIRLAIHPEKEGRYEYFIHSCL